MTQQRKFNRRARAEHRRHGKRPEYPALRPFQRGDMMIYAVDGAGAMQMSDLIAAHCEECAAAIQHGLAPVRSLDASTDGLSD